MDLPAPNPFESAILTDWGAVIIERQNVSDLTEVDHLSRLLFSQIRAFLGISPIPSSVALPDANLGISHWEVDSAIRGKIGLFQS